MKRTVFLLTIVRRAKWLGSHPPVVAGATMIGRVADRGKGVPSFDEMMDIALVEVDFDDPTTNV